MSTNIMPISDLRRHPNRVIQMIRDSGEVVYITQHGRPAAVLVDYEAYEEMQARLAALPAAVSGPEKPVAASLQALASMAIDLGAADLAENHDAYLYGEEQD